MIEDTMGVVQFNITLKIALADMARWEPERIRAFFAGVAQAAAACCEPEPQTPPAAADPAATATPRMG